MELWNETADWVQYLYNFLMLVIPFLAAIAITTASGAATVGTIRYAFTHWVRPSVDEPTDLLVKLLAARAGRDAAWVSRVLVENIDAIIGVLPEEAQPKGS